MPNDKRPRASELEKPLPNNLDAERSVLGAVLLDNRALQPVAEYISSGDFFLDQHRRVFRAMLAMADAGTSIDLVTLTERLFKDGELEAAGGAPYLASLADGMPKISNVGHYAAIVIEKAKLRSLIHMTHNWQQAAFASDAIPAEILSDLSEFVKLSGNGHGGNSLVAVDVLDFLNLKLDPIDFVIEPILPVSNSAMIFSPTGAGKTYIMLQMCYSVAIGAPQIFVWDIPKARPVVYVDGEMDQLTLQERQTEIAKSFLPVLPEKGMLKIITPDQQPKYPPRIDTKEGRTRIEDHLIEGCLLSLDNLVTLCPGGDDKESDNWATQQEWILYLRRKRVSVFTVHHAGKSGDQLGTSKKEIQLSCNLKLRTHGEYTPEDGLRVECRITKLRRRGRNGVWVPKWGQPFEINYRVVDGAAEFSTRPMLDILRKRAVQYLVAGMHPTDVVTETGLSRFTVLRLKKKISAEGIAAAESSEE